MDTDTAQMRKPLADSPFVRAVYALLTPMLAGALWLGVAGAALGAVEATGFTSVSWRSELLIGAVVGFALGAHSGLWAALAISLAAPHRRRLCATLAAGLVNPFLWNFWEGYDPPFRWEEWAGSTLLLVLPFLCGWLFASSLDAGRHLPMLTRARTALASGRARALPMRQRIAAAATALVFGYVAVAGATAALAFLASLANPPSRFEGLD